LSDSPHHHDWDIKSTHLGLTYTLDEWQGVLNGMLHCQGCNSYSIIRLLDWAGKNLQTRVFSLADLPADSAKVFLRNMNSDYCDVTRKQDEANALYFCLGPVTHIVAIEVPGLKLLDSIRNKNTTTICYPDWQTLSPKPESSAWFQLFDF
jgi:hypothetical protein